MKRIKLSSAFHAEDQIANAFKRNNNVFENKISDNDDDESSDDLLMRKVFE